MARETHTPTPWFIRYPLLGCGDGSEERVSEHSCRLAAVAAAERFERDSESERVDRLATDALRLDGAE